jgi:hypothetical protein
MGGVIILILVNTRTAKVHQLRQLARKERNFIQENKKHVSPPKNSAIVFILALEYNSIIFILALEHKEKRTAFAAEQMIS